MADDGILLFAKKNGLILSRAGEAVHGCSLALLPDPPELPEELRKKQTSLESLQKAPLFPRLIATNLEMTNQSSKVVGFVYEDDSPIVHSTGQSTGENLKGRKKSPKTVGSACADKSPNVGSTGKKLQRRKKSSKKVESACAADKSPHVRSTGENQDHEHAVTFRLIRDGKRFYHCSVCDFVKASRAAVLGHIKRLSNANLDTCDCGYKTSNPQCFRQHMSRCANKFVCVEPNCGFETTRKFVMKRHLVSHSEQRFNLWKCDFCDATFTLKSNKKRHEQHFHVH